MQIQVKNMFQEVRKRQTPNIGFLVREGTEKAEQAGLSRVKLSSSRGKFCFRFNGNRLVNIQSTLSIWLGFD